VTVAVKICGLNEPDAVAAAVEAGADMLGFVFYPPSPRAVTPARAAELAAAVPARVLKVGLFVDVDDRAFADTLAALRLDLLQLHGAESVERVGEVRRRFGVPVMKAAKIAGADDVADAARYEGAVDRLLFDAKAPKELKGALPGGNGLAFDWQLIAGRAWRLPWMLSGGLDAGNVAQAIRASGATAVDVSSGVESRPGRKEPRAIAAFVAAAKRAGAGTGMET